MAFINYTSNILMIKIVYYGPGLSGKTTNLRYIYDKVDPSSRGELICLETESERTYFFDLLPIKAGYIGYFKVNFQLMTVPGQVYYEASRKNVLVGTDGVVFVADSQVPLLDANLESLESLRRNFQELKLDLESVPLVFQYNKRDLDNLIPVETLNNLLNPRRLPFIEASAISGQGVFETLKEIARLTIPRVREKIFRDQDGNRRPGAQRAKRRRRTDIKCRLSPSISLGEMEAKCSSNPPGRRFSESRPMSSKSRWISPPDSPISSSSACPTRPSGKARRGSRPPSRIADTSFRRGRSTINFAPADRRKEGPAFDLPIALGHLAYLGIVSPGEFRDSIFMGELALDGRLKPVKGVLSAALLAKKKGFKNIVVPKANQKEAALVAGLDVYGLENLVQVVELLTVPGKISPVRLIPGRAVRAAACRPRFPRSQGAASREAGHRGLRGGRT